MKKLKKIKICLIILLGIVIISIMFIATYSYLLSPISDDKTLIVVDIPKNTTIDKAASILLKNNLIRNKDIFKLYIRLNNKGSIKASSYQLSKSMSTKEIIDILIEGNSYNKDEITITFKEGLNIKQIAQLIAEKTNNTYDEVIDKTKDIVYLNQLVEKYWFITDDIKNASIYFPLEGYLFPDTYIYANKDASTETILNKMLEEMNKKLEPLKSDVENSNYSIHELLTMASIVELEGVNSETRRDIAAVFYNRLNAKWSLGSDVTACYAFGIDISSCNDNVPYQKYNPYNTRSSEMAGKLPIGPICSPSLESIKSAIIPNTNNYFYFVADVNKKVYFMRTNDEFTKTIKEIKERGEWPW